MMQSLAAVGIDLGGTNLKTAVVDACGRLLARHTLPLPEAPTVDAVVEAIAGEVAALLS
ncbi:MAG: ROK family protein, partial [Phycisphaerae bacterium]